MSSISKVLVQPDHIVVYLETGEHITIDPCQHRSNHGFVVECFGCESMQLVQDYESCGRLLLHPSPQLKEERTRRKQNETKTNDEN
jgi:hypothetical protein